MSDLHKINLLYLNRKVYIILFLLLFLWGSGQKISIENKNTSVITLRYNNNKVKLKTGETKTITGKDLNFLYITLNDGKSTEQALPIFLNSGESLDITVNDYNDVDFKGDKGELHKMIVNQQHTILYKNVVKYQNIFYSKKNTKELINFSELILSEYLAKIRSLNASPLGREDERYKRMEKYAVQDWISSLFLFLTGKKTLDHQSKELMLYYYNTYMVKDIENFDCDVRSQYSNLSELARYSSQLGISLPTYTLIEKTEDDSVNQYLPEKCQAYYFKNKFNYYNKINSEDKEYYLKVLKEKFNNK